MMDEMEVTLDLSRVVAWFGVPLTDLDDEVRKP